MELNGHKLTGYSSTLNKILKSDCGHVWQMTLIFICTVLITTKTINNHGRKETKNFIVRR